MRKWLILLAGCVLLVSSGCVEGPQQGGNGDLPPSTRGVLVGTVQDTAPAGRQEFGAAQIWTGPDTDQYPNGQIHVTDYPVVVCANNSNGNNSDAFLGRVLQVEPHPEYGGRYFWFESTPGGNVGFYHLTLGGCRYGRITFPALENQQANVLVCIFGGARVWLWHVEREPGFSCEYAGFLELGEAVK